MDAVRQEKKCVSALTVCLGRSVFCGISSVWPVEGYRKVAPFGSTYYHQDMAGGDLLGVGQLDVFLQPPLANHYYYA